MNERIVRAGGQAVVGDPADAGVDGGGNGDVHAAAWENVVWGIDGDRSDSTPDDREA